jgi:hypothetical protein
MFRDRWLTTASLAVSWAAVQLKPARLDARALTGEPGGALRMDAGMQLRQAREMAGDGRRIGPHPKRPECPL